MLLDVVEIAKQRYRHLKADGGVVVQGGFIKRSHKRHTEGTRKDTSKTHQRHMEDGRRRGVVAQERFFVVGIDVYIYMYICIYGTTYIT